MYSSILSAILSLDRKGWLLPCPGHFTRGKIPVTNCTGGWVGIRAGVNGYGKSGPSGFELWTVQSIKSCYTNYDILAATYEKIQCKKHKALS
jgi:hypothetical protein